MLLLAAELPKHVRHVAAQASPQMSRTHARTAGAGPGPQLPQIYGARPPELAPGVHVAARQLSNGEWHTSGMSAWVLSPI